MDESTAEHEDVLVLSDQQGACYVIPRTALEEYRATAEQKTQIEAVLGEDVSGYFMTQEIILEQIARETPAARLREANQAAMAREARHGQSPAPGIPLIGTFLKLFKPARTPVDAPEPTQM